MSETIQEVQEKQPTIMERVEYLYRAGLVNKLGFRNMQNAARNQHKKRYQNLEKIMGLFGEYQDNK